jgi:hypothetical protein
LTIFSFFRLESWQSGPSQTIITSTPAIANESAIKVTECISLIESEICIIPIWLASMSMMAVGFLCLWRHFINHRSMTLFDYRDDMLELQVNQLEQKLHLTLETHSLVTEMEEDAKLALAIGIMLRSCPQNGIFVMSDAATICGGYCKHVGLLLQMDVCRCNRGPGITPKF